MMNAVQDRSQDPKRHHCQWNGKGGQGSSYTWHSLLSKNGTHKVPIKCIG